MVNQLERRNVLVRKVGELPQKVADLALGLAKELWMNLRQGLALHGRHEEDAGVVVVRRHVLPFHWDLTLDVGRNVDDRERDIKVVKHGGE